MTKLNVKNHVEAQAPELEIFDLYELKRRYEEKIVWMTETDANQLLDPDQNEESDKWRGHLAKTRENLKRVKAVIAYRMRRSR